MWRRHRLLTIGGLAVTDIVTVDGHQFIMEDGGWVWCALVVQNQSSEFTAKRHMKDRVAAILNDGMKIAGLRE